MFMKSPQIEPVTRLARDHKAVFAKLKAGPVFPAQRSQAAAVLVSVEQWDAMVKHITRLEMMAASERISSEMDADANKIVSHAELKRQLAEKKVHVGA